MGKLTPSRLAKVTNIHVETLRYYEKRGLLPKPQRNVSGYRVYTTDYVNRIRFIKGAQSLGFTLAEIQDLLDLSVRETANCENVHSHAQRKIDDVDIKIEKLLSIRDALSNLINQCEQGKTTSECPVLDNFILQPVNQPKQEQ